MKFTMTRLAGVVEIRPDLNFDERGSFGRCWCQKEFENQGLNSRLVQCSFSFNPRKGTLRGLHYQDAPYQEVKLVRCTRGSIYDVVVDLRPESPTFKQWISVVLTDEWRNMLYVPEGCAHGVLTLEEQTEVFYQMSEFYHADLSCGVRWDDPAFRIVWPAQVEVISERDRTYPNFQTVQCAY